MWTVALQFVVGGLIVVAQTYFANSSSPFVAGLIYATPMLFLPSVYFIKDKQNLSSFAIYAALMLLALFVYDISYFLLLKRFSKLQTTFLAFIPWGVAALATGHLASRLAPGTRGRR